MAEISLKRLHSGGTNRNSPGGVVCQFPWPEAQVVALALLGAGYTVKTRLRSSSSVSPQPSPSGVRLEVSGLTRSRSSLFPIFLAAVLCGPLGAMAVSVSSMLGEETRPFTRWVLYASSRSLTGAIAGLVASGFGLRPFLRFCATAAAAVCTQILDLAFAALVFSLRGHGSPFAALRETGPLSLTGSPLYVPAVSSSYGAMSTMAPGMVLPLFLAPALAAQRSFVLYQAERSLRATSRRSTSTLNERTSPSRQRSSRRSTQETNTQPATPPRSPSTPAILPSGWASQKMRSSLRTCVALFTTSARSAYPPDSWKSLVHSRWMKDGRWKALGYRREDSRQGG